MTVKSKERTTPRITPLEPAVDISEAPPLDLDSEDIQYVMDAACAAFTVGKLDTPIEYRGMFTQVELEQILQYIRSEGLVVVTPSSMQMVRMLLFASPLNKDGVNPDKGNNPDPNRKRK